MTKEEALKMLSEAVRDDSPSKMNQIFTRRQAVEIIEKGIIAKKDGEVLMDLFVKRVYQVCRNQRRPRY
jgi:hypothetical protein